MYILLYLLSAQNIKYKFILCQSASLYNTHNKCIIKTTKTLFHIQNEKIVKEKTNQFASDFQSKGQLDRDKQTNTTTFSVWWGGSRGGATGGQWGWVPHYGFQKKEKLEDFG